MKKIANYTIFILVVLSACTKDKGSYNYQNQDIITINNVDSSIFLEFHNSYQFTPEVKDQEGNIIISTDTTNYKFEWLLYNNTAAAPALIADSLNFLMQGEANKFKTVLTSGNLDRTLTFGWGPATLEFKVTDKRTGYFKTKMIGILFGNDIYEGWFILGETASHQSQLSMVSIRNNTDTIITDVLKYTNSKFPVEALPTYVKFAARTNIVTPIAGGSTSGSALALGTAVIGGPLNADSLYFSSSSTYLTMIRSNPRPISLQNNYYYPTSSYNDFLYADSTFYTIYYSNSDNSSITPPVTGNIVDEQGTRLGLSHFVGLPYYLGNYSSFLWNYIVYDVKSHRFLRVISTKENIGTKLPDGSLFSYQDLSTSLVFMQFSDYNSGEVVAILKNKNEEYFLAKFRLTGEQLFYKKINATDIANATNFAIDRNYGYIFYNSGSKLYEYDYNLDNSFLMKNFGSENISLVAFQTFNKVSYSNLAYSFTANPHYEDLASQLIVGTYSETDLNTSGKIMLYQVGAVNGPLTQNYKYEGFAKPVSITYRER